VVIVRQPSREEVLEAEVERLRHENRRLKHREHEDEDF
jgi:hypothetical protein